MHQRQAEIATRDGAMPTWICHPQGAGAHPALIFYMDAPGMREELRAMCRRLAAAGYYVMLPDLYYRSHHGDMGPFRGDEDAQHKQLIGRLMGSIGIELVMADTAALIAHARADPAAAPGALGCVGYCMSGQYALNAAARFADEIAAAACFYGTHLMTEREDSPHRVVRDARAEIYVGWAGIDPFAPMEQLAPFSAALQAAGADARVELYPDVWHGFAFPERLVYNADAAERHWERLLDLFGRKLGSKQ
ncbi:dienelactone hydrolase family protein [Duganella sp. SAP-35]|uniref:Dienelactone hydrolase family protein n=1 Tax=Duganella aceris TaxID=2703883 RepID=A0ABX0FFM8_9BURK|nr:dienelactone hydrolase family protein [Duganella aceris]